MTYCSLLDKLGFDDVTWRSYEKHSEIQDFEEIVWYSSWIMCGVDKVYHHLPERVKQQYRYVQNVLRHPTNVVELRVTQIMQAFIDFHTHTIKKPDRGEPAGETTWQMEDNYMLWYGLVSHPQIFPLIPGSPLRPANEEQIVAHQWEQYEARGSPDTYEMINGNVAYADEQLGHDLMSPGQWSAAMRHVQEQIAQILTRR